MHVRRASLALLFSSLVTTGLPSGATAQRRTVASDIAEWIHSFKKAPDATTPAGRAEHGGSVKGFGASVYLDPEADLAVAICANNYNAPAFEPLIAELFRQATQGR